MSFPLLSTNKNLDIMLFSKHVVAKVILVPCSVKQQLIRDKAGHGEVTRNNAATVGQRLFIVFIIFCHVLILHCEIGLGRDTR